MFKPFTIAVVLMGILGCQSLAQESDRTQYHALDPEEFLSSRSLNSPHPREVALSLFEKYTQESEGRKSEVMAIEYPTWEIAIVTVAIVGLADDSLRGRRYRLEFQRDKNGNWQLDWIGSQIQCQEGRGHQHWGRDLCS